VALLLGGKSIFEERVVEQMASVSRLEGVHSAYERREEKWKLLLAAQGEAQVAKQSTHGLGGANHRIRTWAVNVPG
jgi:hypothetical protein